MHDANGSPLQEGDVVMIPCKILKVHAAEEFCNVDVEFLNSMPPYTHKDKLSALNTKQVVLLERPKG